MRGQSISMAGSVFARPNGTFTAVTPPLPGDQPGRKRRPSLGTFATREEARAELRRANIEGFDGQARPTPSELAQMTLEAYLDRWVLDLADEEHDGRIVRSTRQDYEQVVRKHLIPELGRVRLGDLTSERVTAWLGRLRAKTIRGKPLSDRTVQKVYRVLYRALGDSGLPTNPARLGRRDRPQVRTSKTIMRPTVDEVRAFLAHLECCERPGAAPLLPLWRLMASTGLRRSEAAGLTWDDLHLDEEPSYLTVVRGLHDDGKFYVGKPKSRESSRTVGLDPKARSLLVDLRDRTRGLRPVRVTSGEGHVDLDLVFRSGQGRRPLSPDTVSQRFVEEWAHSGGPAGVTLHGLRHGLGSALLAAGRPVTEVAAQLGHSPAVLLGTYARDLDAAKRHVAVAATTARLYG